jgi:hypothetical protein
VSRATLDARRRPQVVFPVVLVPGVVAVSIAGQVQYDLFTDEGSSLWSNVFTAVFVVCVFAAPFMLIAIFLVDGLVGTLASLVAFAIGVAGLVVVPWLVEKAIEDDPSSTASLAHMWDPVLITILVGVVLFTAWGLEALARRHRSDAS